MLGNMLGGIINRRPNAISLITGSNEYPEIKGTVKLYQTCYGVIVVAEVKGLPLMEDNNTCGCDWPIFGFHIHSGDRCCGNEEDPFADALTHYNSWDCPHPYHAGDLPPLFGNNGYALSVFLTDRFTVNEVIDRTIIVHSDVDDFVSQPSGNSGKKIACGQIVRCC